MKHHITPFFRVCGALCYAFVAPYPTDKFSLRTFKGVFLGYPYNQKGYKVLNIETRKVVITRNIQFFEHIFLFSLSYLLKVGPCFLINPLMHLMIL